MCVSYSFLRLHKFDMYFLRTFRTVYYTDISNLLCMNVTEINGVKRIIGGDCGVYFICNETLHIDPDSIKNFKFRYRVKLFKLTSVI